jgi:Zn-finger nucleic acid-binding protein
MQCPVCKKHTMATVELAPNLSGLKCSQCSGTWIARSHYDAWRRKQPGHLPEISTPVQVTISETHKAKICPECRHLLLPYRVGHGLPFSIDYCGACGGVWLDAQEWEAIKTKNLHDNLHDMVSTHWQNEVRKEEVQVAAEQTYKRLLGPAYDKATEFRSWLCKHPQKALILAYLSGTKPEKE